MNETAIENPKIALLTGASGFIGRHLVTRLIECGWRVHVVVRTGSILPTTWRDAVQVHSYDGTTECLLGCLEASNPDVVFHLASLFLFQHTVKDLTPLVQSNILFGCQLLESMTLHGVRCFVNTGTSWQHYNNKNYDPVCLYAATKQSFEALLEYYVAAHAFSAVTLKLFDTYGPDDPRPKLFNLLEKAAATGEVLNLSSGEQLIDLVHVDDVVDAYLIAAAIATDAEGGHSIYGVSSGRPLALKTLVEKYEKKIGRPIPVNWGARPYRFREVMIPWNNYRTLPGWEPRKTELIHNE